MSTLEERVERLERRIDVVEDHASAIRAGRPSMLMSKVGDPTDWDCGPTATPEPGGFEVYTVEWPPAPGPEAMERAILLERECDGIRTDPHLLAKDEPTLCAIARAIEEAVAEEGDKGRRVRKNQTQAHGEIVADLRARLAEAEKALEAEKLNKDCNCRALVEHWMGHWRSRAHEAERDLECCRAGRDELSKGWDLCMKERDEARKALEEAKK